MNASKRRAQKTVKEKQLPAVNPSASLGHQLGTLSQKLKIAAAAFEGLQAMIDPDDDDNELLGFERMIYAGACSAVNGLLESCAELTGDLATEPGGSELRHA